MIVCKQRSECSQNAADSFERIKERLRYKELLNVIGERHHAVCCSPTHSYPSCRNMFVLVVKEKQE